MDSRQRERLINRICAGIIRLHLTNTTLVIRRPSHEAMVIADELYEEQLGRATEENLMDDDEVLDFLIEHDFWDEERQNLLVQVPRDIEEFKVALVKAEFKTNERNEIKAVLGNAKTKLAGLLEQRHSYDYLSRSSAAALYRNRYLLARSLYSTGGDPIFSHAVIFNHPKCDLLEQAMQLYLKAKLSETDFRELARTDPWRSLWSTRRAESSLFGVPVIDHTEEQRSLLGWSNLYENICEHPNSPSEWVINDDDALDGWMIIQRREREAKMNQVSADALLQNDKIRNSEEVYLMADTQQDAARIDTLNDDIARRIKKQRFKKVQEQGTVSEADMPDARQKIKMLRNQNAARQIAGGAGSQ